eukprot:TRINITY_DN816_c0_g1_i1.p1 TRINITY_DN816_c0_g1~~TRINITY_DN816_c0_g1_i1.p1  ORF type:complete len:132 (+),score=15.58 TRINITY_DN816_c0_g1_i1:56-451(+)
MNHVRLILTVFFFASSVLSFCPFEGPYHVAAKAFAEGLGNVTTASPCVYGNADQVQDSSCPLPCKALIVATWGDCYCKDPEYVPGVSNEFISTLTVRQLFSVLATRIYFPAANCRQFLQEPDNYQQWTCSN